MTIVGMRLEYVVELQSFPTSIVSKSIPQSYAHGAMDGKQPPVETDIRETVARLIDEQTCWDAATRHDDERAIERHAENGLTFIQRLTESAAGKAALERLLFDTSPGLRLAAATAVIQWDPDQAISVLARLMYEEFTSNAAPWADAGFRIHARIQLLQYFELSDFQALPNRLADMGIELPDWLARELRRET